MSFTVSYLSVKQHVYGAICARWLYLKWEFLNFFGHEIIIIFNFIELTKTSEMKSLPNIAWL